MKLAVRISIVIAAVAIVALLIFPAKNEPEPMAYGKPLSYWTFQLVSEYPRRNKEAIEAIRTMGDPAIRHLTEMVEKDNSPFAKRLLKNSDQVPLIGSFVHSKYWYRWLGALALGELGTNATAAVPALKKMSADPEGSLAATAAAALVLIQNEPLEKYIAAYLDYSNKSNHILGYSVLVYLGPRAEAAVPMLLRELESTNNRIRLGALTVLQTVGVESQLCATTMTNLLSDPDSTIRYSAVDVLANSGPLAKPATPLIASLLNDPEDLCQSSALIFFLQAVSREEFAPYRPAVQNMTNSMNETTRSLAEKVLREKTDKP